MIRKTSLLSDDWNAAAVPWNAVMKLSGRPILASACWMAATAAPSEYAGRDIERHRRRGELAEMGDHQRAGSLLDVRDRRKRHLAVGRRRRRRQVDRGQPGRATLQRRVELEDDAVLVRLRVDGRDDALPERIVERVVDGGRRDAEAARGGAVDDQIDRQALLLQVARDVGRAAAAGSAAATSFGTQVLNSVALASSSTKLYGARLTVESMVRSCTGCM